MFHAIHRLPWWATLVATALLAGCGPSDSERAMQAQRDTLRSQLTAARADIAARDGRLKGLKAEAEGLRELNTTQAKDLKRTEADLEAARKQLADAGDGTKVLKQENAKLNAAMANEKQRADVLQVQVNQLRVSLRDTRSAQKEAEEQVKSLTASRAAASAELAKLKQAHTTLKREHARLQARQTELTTRAERQQQQIAGQRKRIAKLEKLADAATEHAAQLDRKLNASAAEVRRLTGVQADLQARLDAAEARARIAQQERDLAQEAIAALKPLSGMPTPATEAATAPAAPPGTAARTAPAQGPAPAAAPAAPSQP